MYKFRYVSNGKHEIFNRWKAFPMSSACVALQLSDVAEVSVKKGRPINQGRRQRPETIGYGSEYELDVKSRDF